MLYLASRAFGKFQSTFLSELHAEIISHLKQEASGLVPRPVQGIVVHGSEVLEPEMVRPGGLMRIDTVKQTSSLPLACSHHCTEAYISSASETYRTSDSPRVSSWFGSPGQREERPGNCRKWTQEEAKVGRQCRFQRCARLHCITVQ